MTWKQLARKLGVKGVFGAFVVTSPFIVVAAIFLIGAVMIATNGGGRPDEALAVAGVPFILGFVPCSLAVWAGFHDVLR